LLTFQQNPIDFTERQAEREQKMTMQDWAGHLDRILTMSGENVLQGAGNISHEQAVEKATTEYKKYQAKTLSEAEKNYLESLRQIEKISKKKETQTKNFSNSIFLNQPLFIHSPTTHKRICRP